MPVVTSNRIGEPCWIDYASSDVAASRAFYADLFGWQAEESGPEYGGYVLFSVNGHQVAGLGPKMAAGPDGWTTYLAVEDAEASEKAAVAAGAQVYAPTMTVGSQGKLAVLADPGGAAFGLWQPLEHRGYGLTGEVGAVVWHELNARRFDEQVGFYRDVFGWTPEVLSDTPEFRYITFGPGGPGNMVGGVYDAAGTLSEGVPSHWTTYFGVDDVDASAARAVTLGGSIIREPWDSPFGRFAQIADPAGRVFLLSTVGPAETAS